MAVVGRRGGVAWGGGAARGGVGGVGGDGAGLFGSGGARKGPERSCEGPGGAVCPSDATGGATGDGDGGGSEDFLYHGPFKRLHRLCRENYYAAENHQKSRNISKYSIKQQITLFKKYSKIH